MTPIKNLLHDFSINEAKIEKLYKKYASLFPDFKNLWLGLAQEEKRHALMLEKLNKITALKNKDIELNEYSAQIIDYISNFIDNTLSEANSGKINIKKALETALSLELSMLEKKSFEMFKPLNPDINSVFGQLNQETKDHAKILSLTLDRL